MPVRRHAQLLVLGVWVLEQRVHMLFVWVAEYSKE